MNGKTGENGLHIQTAGKTLQQVIMQAEALYIAETLNRTGFNKKQAAAQAGVSYNRFLEKVNRLNLTHRCEVAA